MREFTFSFRENSLNHLAEFQQLSSIRFLQLLATDALWANDSLNFD
jgi:hypothetical protein